MLPNKEMKLTKPGQNGASQLISSVGRTQSETMNTGLEIGRELMLYAPAWLALGLVFGIIVHRAIRGVPQREPPPRPSFDAGWFLPVYIGGICSVFHAHAALWSNLLLDRRYHSSLIQYGALLLQGAFSAGVLGLLLLACFLAERWARRVGLGARTSHGALPPPVAAALMGVLGNWALCVMLFFPLSWQG